jgi:hypothetical protein
VARGGVMCADGCAAGSYKGAAVRGAKSRVVGMCVEGAGVTGGQGLTEARSSRARVGEETHGGGE